MHFYSSMLLNTGPERSTLYRDSYRECRENCFLLRTSSLPISFSCYRRSWTFFLHLASAFSSISCRILLPFPSCWLLFCWTPLLNFQIWEALSSFLIFFPRQYKLFFLLLLNSLFHFYHPRLSQLSLLLHTNFKGHSSMMMKLITLNHRGFFL